MAKKATHGGKRPGSGRQTVNPEGPVKIVSAGLPVALIEQLDKLADAKGWSRSRAIAEAIRRFVGKK